MYVSSNLGCWRKKEQIWHQTWKHLKRRWTKTPTNHILNDGGPRYKHASFDAGYSNQRPLPVPDEPYPPPSPQWQQPFIGGLEMTFVPLEICVPKHFPIKGVATLEKYMVVWKLGFSPLCVYLCRLMMFIPCGRENVPN